MPRLALVTLYRTRTRATTTGRIDEPDEVRTFAAILGPDTRRRIACWRYIDKGNKADVAIQ